jgi:predicted PurR-regulated permease PerM
VLIVGLVDNVLTTFVYGKKINMHPLIILFSVLGGIAFFGPIGFLFGPLVVTLLFVLIQMYRVIVLGTGDDQVS